MDKQAKTQQTAQQADMKARALLAFTTAVTAYVLASEEAQSLAGSEWERYVLAARAGATSEELSQAAADCTDYDEDDKAARSRCRQYAYRLRLLTDAGVAIVNANGSGLLDEVTARVNGKDITGTPGGVAQQIAKAKAAKRTPRAGSKGEDKAPETLAPVAIDVALMARVAEALRTDANLADVLIEQCPDVVLAMAERIAKVRLEASIVAEARKRKAAMRKDASAGEVAEAGVAAALTMERANAVAERATAH